MSQAQRQWYHMNHNTYEFLLKCYKFTNLVWPLLVTHGSAGRTRLVVRSMGGANVVMCDETMHVLHQKLHAPKLCIKWYTLQHTYLYQMSSPCDFQSFGVTYSFKCMRYVMLYGFWHVLMLFLIQPCVICWTSTGWVTKWVFTWSD